MLIIELYYTALTGPQYQRALFPVLPVHESRDRHAAFGPTRDIQHPLLIAEVERDEITSVRPFAQVAQAGKAAVRGVFQRTVISGKENTAVNTAVQSGMS